MWGSWQGIWSPPCQACIGHLHVCKGTVTETLGMKILESEDRHDEFESWLGHLLCDLAWGWGDSISLHLFAHLQEGNSNRTNLRGCAKE